MVSAVATSACATNAQSVWQSAMVRINADSLEKARMLQTSVAVEIQATIVTRKVESTSRTDAD